MTLQSICVAMLLFTVSVAKAAPSVSQDTISWPDDGWYQVLNESNYSEVCSGGRSCTVAPGSYLVINHTTGERFAGITVNLDNTNNSSSPIVVTNSVISWPNDGWYQVQSPTTYESLCEGGTSCAVPDGTYSVINHTKGLRWDDVMVGGSDPSSPATIRVDFDITVPAYMSDELQVKVNLGDTETTAAWVRDESWAISLKTPANAETPLLVTFNDDNGAITLGSFETTLRTGADESESFQITADQFDTSRWDSGGDGVSNLSELLAGTYSQDNVALESAQATLELVADKTFRISWPSSTGAQFYRVMENPDGLSGFTQISGDLASTRHTFDHRVALYKRFDARYIVQACNSTGCIDSDELIVSGALEQAIGYFKADNTEFESLFGGAISFSVDGNTLAVGASGTAHSDDRGETDSAYVFQRSNGSWLLQDKLRPNSDDAFSDGFGRDVSLSADGNTLAVGAYRDNSVYIFERTDGAWL